MIAYSIYLWINAASLTVILLSFWRKKGIYDVPNHRSAHLKAIPTAAGVCISAVFLIFGIAAFYGIIKAEKPSIAFLVGFLTLTVVGFFDDWKELNYKTRLLSHAFSVLLVISQENLSLPETALWFFVGVGLINACNFLDGLNGLLASQWLLTTGFLLSAFAPGDSLFWILWISTLIYLFYNFPQAKLFIGDTGSTILGFSYFAIIFTLAPAQNGFPNFVLPHDGFLIFALFPLAFAWGDVVFTIARRFHEKRSVIWSFGDYGFHLLAKYFGNHFQVTLLYLALNFLLTGGLAVLFKSHPYAYYIGFFYVALQSIHWILIYKLSSRLQP